MRTKKVLLVLAVALCITAGLFVIVEMQDGSMDAEAANGGTPSADIYVDDDADPSWYNATHVRTVQEGIDNATAGDTVFVYNGTYYENVAVNKTMNLIGEYRNGTVIDGRGNGNVVYVSASWVNISRFWVRNGSSGLELDNIQGCHIENTIVSDNDDGIPLRHSSNCSIKNTTIIHNERGIHLYFSTNCIINNVSLVNDGLLIGGNIAEFTTHTIGNSTVNGKPLIYWKDKVGGTVPSGAGEIILANCTGVTVENQNVGNGDIGIEICFSLNCTIDNVTATGNDVNGLWLALSDGCHITNVTACDNGDYGGLWLALSDGCHITNVTAFNNSVIGIDMHNSDGCTLGDAVVRNNSGDGIGLDFSSNCTIFNTIVSGNMKGITLQSFSNNTTLTNNAFYNNDEYGLLLSNSSRCLVYHNNFINNSQQAYDNGNNIWYNATLREGNYWSDFDEVSEGAYDNDRDGIIDSPYNISGGDNQDLYPLAAPSQTVIEVETKSEIMDLNETFTLNITVYPDRPIKSVQCDLHYDPSKLKATDVSRGNIFTECSSTFITGTIDNANGIISGIASLILGHGNTSQRGTLATIMFEPKTIGTSQLELNNTIVVDEQDNTINHAIIPGSVTVKASIYVDDDYNSSTSGWHIDKWTNVQDALDNASQGEAIFVYNGTYEEHIIVNKTVELIGEDREQTIIKNIGINDTLIIRAEGTKIAQFRVKNSLGHPCQIYSPNNYLYACTFTNGFHNCTEIWSSNNTFVACDFTNSSDYGITVGKQNNAFTRCSFHNNSKGGILLMSASNNTFKECQIKSNINGVDSYWFDKKSSGNNFFDCEISENMYGMHIPHAPKSVIKGCIVTNNMAGGINTSQESPGTVIRNCAIKNNGEWGIILGYADNFTVSNCQVSNHQIGVAFWGSDNSTITECTLTNNSRGIHIPQIGNTKSSSNMFYRNSFVNNTQQAYDECTNTWYNPSIKTGNYWSDYNGTDKDGDLIGEQPYNISGGNNQDLYPLTETHRPVIAVETVDKAMTLNETFTINITVFPYRPIQGLQCDLHFDPSLLKVTDVSEGPLFDGYSSFFIAGTIDNVNGTISGIASLILGDGSTSQRGILATVTFKPKSFGTSSLKLDDTAVIDEESRSINHAIINGSATITPSTIYVNDDADPSWYDATHVRTVQEGIDNASSGDTVYVLNGTYYENVVVNKTIDLIGEDRNRTVIDGGGVGKVVYLTANEINITGFKVINGGPYWDDGAGIELYSANRCNIESNIVSNKQGAGIRISWESSNNTIISNTAFNNSNGILLSYFANYNNILHNTLSNNSNGVCLWYNNDNIMSGNTILYNEYGINLFFSNNNTMSGNTISQNQFGIYLKNASTNLIYNNYFNNTNNANDNRSNMWNIAKEDVVKGEDYNIIGGDWFGGNYWSDYNGMDTDGDGLGDTNLPYNSSRNIQFGGDYHPLVYEQPSDWNIWDDDGVITLSELQEALNHWINDIPINGIHLETSHMQILIYQWMYEDFTTPPQNHSVNVTGIRNIEPRIVEPGDTFQVTVSLSAYGYVTAPALDEDVPAGWTVTPHQTSSGWQYKISTVEWLLIGDWTAGDSATFVYDVTVPESVAPNTYIINGHVSGSYTTEETIGGDSQIIVSEDIPTVYVDDDYDSSTPGWQYDHFDTIQDGIDAVTVNGTVYVYNGTYYENVVVNKTIDLIGEDRNNTIIDGGGSGEVVKISANNVIINEFGVQDGSIGIKIGTHRHNCIIKGNNITHNSYLGVHLLWYSHNCTVTGNKLYSNYRGILIEDSDNNTIIDNNVSNNLDGILVTIPNGGKCIDNIITGNVVLSNTRIGIFLMDATYNNTLYNNYFNNINNTLDHGDNIWNITKTAETNIVGGPYLGGNYWSDYNGTDTDGDGLGDTNLPHNCSGNIHYGGDYHPLTLETNQPPVANFTYHPSYPTTSSTITFRDQSGDSDGSIVNWTWSFGDGNVSYSQNPQHRYPNPGTYTVVLTVTDDEGASDTHIANISVRVPSPPPVPPYTPSLPDSDMLIYFDGPCEWNRTHWDVLAGTLICVDMDVAQDAGLTSLYYRVDNGSWERWTDCICSCALSPGMHSIYYYGVDAHGRHTNTARIVIDVVNGVAPITLYDVYPPHPPKYTGWYTDAVTIRLDAVDGVSGVSGTYYRFNEGNWLEYTGEIVVATDGRYTLEYYSVDNAGNEEQVQSTSFRIDKTSPILTFSRPTSGHLYLFGREILPLKQTVFIGQATLAVDAVDETAGIKQVEFYIDDELQKTVTDEPFELVWDEPSFWRHTIQAIAIDRADNTAAVEQEIWIFNI